MTENEYSGKKINFDSEGFMNDLTDWNEDIAKIIATKEGVKSLTEEQMEIIKFLRNYFQRFNSFPVLNYVCKNVQQPRNCINEQFINPELAWKIAGLPKLSAIHFVAVDGKNFRMEECC